MHELVDFAEFVVIDEYSTYTWVIEYREVDGAGTPYDERWEVWHTTPTAENRALATYPEKNSVIAGCLAEIRAHAFHAEKNFEYRIKLSRHVEKDEDLAATEPWTTLNAEERPERA